MRFIMVAMKRVVKSVVLFLASSLYVWLLFIVASTAMTFLVLRDPATIKSWLADSGLYSNIVTEVSKLATIQQKQENALVQITAEDIEDAAKQAFPPETLKADAETAVDGFYAWAKGETASPQFSIDFSGRQATFAAIMTDKLKVKIEQLPECTDTSRFTIQAFDPFKAECRPKGVDLTAELSTFQKELAESNSLLPMVKITGDDVKLRDSNGESRRVSSSLPWVQNAYKILQFAPLSLGVLAFLSALALVFFSSTKRKGFRRVANGLLFTGGILVISGFFLRPAFERLNTWSSSAIGAQASINQTVLDPIFYQISKTFARYSIIIGIAYVVPALLIYAILLITRTKEHTETEQEQVQEAPWIRDEPESTQPVAEAQETPPTPVQPPRPVLSPPTAQAPKRPVTRRPPMIQG